MRNDVTAGIPLLFLIAGLAIGPVLVWPWVAFWGLLVAGCWWRFGARNLVFVSLGIWLALQVQRREARESVAFAALDAERFTSVVVPLERDWAERDSAYVLRASSFTANGVGFDDDIAVYARFPPPEMRMEATLRAEGFLRRNERGAYSLSLKSAELMSYEGTLPRWHPKAWNRALANRFEAFADRYPDEVALAQALVLGRGERLTDEMRDSFRRGGTYHLLVFSGLQIAFAAGLLAMLLRRLHAPRASDWLLAAFAALAPLFIGPTASVSRASLAIALYALSRICKRPTSLENLWCVAALLRLIVEPRDLIDASFHLTYAGAGALLFIGRHLTRRKAVGLALGAEVAIAPLTLFHFHQYALGGTVLTFLMAPLIFAMLVVSTVAAVFPPAFALVGVLHRLCLFLNTFGFPGWYAAPPLAAMLAGAAAALLAISLLRGRTRAVAVVLALLLPTAAAIVRSNMRRSVAEPRVTFLDVGQGDAILLRSGTRSMLVDGGRDASLLAKLADRGLRRIDAVVLTHAHPDHCGGLAPLVAQFDVGAVYVNPRRFRGDCATDLLAAASASRTPIHLLRDRQNLTLGAFDLSAYLADLRFRRAPENNASIVLRASTGGRSFLLTGDIEREAELTLGDRDLRADVLKVAHHGSRSSTGESFLDAVAPRIAVISCGRQNLFGHPHSTVLEALEERGIRTWRTDRDGSVEVEVRDGRVYVTATR